MTRCRGCRRYRIMWPSRGGSDCVKTLGSMGRRSVGSCHAVAEIADADEANFAPIYPDEMPLAGEDRDYCKRIYRAEEVLGRQKICDQLKQWEEQGYGNLPVCMAKTQYQLQHGPDSAVRQPAMSCRCARCGLSAGAGFIVVICGEIMTMPGLPRVPSSESIMLNKQGMIEGLF